MHTVLYLIKGDALFEFKVSKETADDLFICGLLILGVPKLTKVLELLNELFRIEVILRGLRILRIHQI